MSTSRLALKERDFNVGSNFVREYLCFDSVVKAYEVFDRLLVRDVVKWTALIVQNVKHGHQEEALECLEKMQLEGVFPDAVTFICSLKACSSMRDIVAGQKIHAEAERRGFVKRNLTLGNALIHMYSTCGSLPEAKQTFDMLSVRDIASWTALMAGFVESGYAEEGLKIFEQMQNMCISPNDVTFVCALKACGSIMAVEAGQKLHAEIQKRSLLESNAVIGNALVDMYTKCHLLDEAHQVFHNLTLQDVISWNSLIGGYAEHGYGEDALHLFEQMQFRGVYPNAVTFTCILKACASVGAIDTGQAIHAEVSRKELTERDIVMGSTLVEMYAQCGLLTKAQQVFDKLFLRTVVTWNALISGYADRGHAERALRCFEHMLHTGVSPDAVTLLSCLKACLSIGACKRGENICADIENVGLISGDTVVGTAIVHIYARHGLLEKAQEVFDTIAVRNIISWNLLITGYVENEHDVEALERFEQMQHEGITPNAVTYIGVLQACGNIKLLDKGREIHNEVLRKGLIEKDIHVGSSLVDMHAKCGSLLRAQEVFDELPCHNVVSWNALIAGYVDHGFGSHAISCFEKMQSDGFSPDDATFVLVFKACGSIGAIDKGLEIHVKCWKSGLLAKDTVGNSLVDMYAKCGMLSKARYMFDNVVHQCIVTWNTLITGYTENGQGEEALKCFEQMQKQGMTPSTVTIICTLKSCGMIGASGKGKQLHAEFERKGLPKRDLVGSSLVYMYGKCGLLAMAEEVFDMLHSKSIVSWNALMAGYVQQGDAQGVFFVFHEILREGTKPDLVTFVLLLSMCSQRGLNEKGQMYISAMSRDFGIAPTLEHHTCMVDLLGRAGELGKLVLSLRKLPSTPDIVVWHTVLDACMKSGGSADLGKMAFEHAMHLDTKDAAAYVLLSNVYSCICGQNGGNKLKCVSRD